MIYRSVVSARLMVTLLILLASPLSAQTAHGVIETRERVSGPVPSGFVQATPGRVVVGFWHSVVNNSGPQLVVILDDQTLTPVAEVLAPLQTVRVFDRSMFFIDAARTGSFRALADGHMLGEVDGSVTTAASDDAFYLGMSNGHVQRYDPTTGKVLWDKAIEGAQFTPRSVATVRFTRDGVWAGNEDGRHFVHLRASDGRETARYDMPQAETQGAAAAQVLPTDDRDYLVLTIPGVTVGRERGTLFRLIGDRQPKDLLVRGAEPYVSELGRWDSDSRVVSFERRSKTYTLVEARSDGSNDGPLDCSYSIDVKRWRSGERTRRLPTGSMLVSSLGYRQVEEDIWDLADGKKVASVSGGARWVAVSERYAVSQDPATHEVEVVPLAGGERRKVPFADATGVECVNTRFGDWFLVTARRDGGSTTIGALDPRTGAIIEVATHDGASELVTAAPRVIAGKLWLLVSEGEGAAIRLHLYGVTVPE
jgi:hypothetical protein